MNINRYNSSLVLWTVTLLLLPFAATDSQGQEEEAMWTDLWTTHVKTGRTADYVELQTKLAKALKAAGRPSRDVWQEIRGDRQTFHSVTRAHKLAQYDEPFDPPMDEDAWSDWVAAITDTIDHSTRMILRRHTEYSTVAIDETEPNLLYLRYRTVGPGKMDDYHDWVENSLSPALREGGANVTFSHITLGGNNRTWISASRLDDWAQMDGEGPLASYMSEAEIDALLAPAAEMVVAIDNRLLRYRPDMSY